MPGPRDVLAGRLRHQASWCAGLGSPFYAMLLDLAARDVELGGPAFDVLEGFEEEPGTAALALRLMGAVHRLVLEEALPELARRYPSVGGDGDATAAWPVFREALAHHGERLRGLIAGGCQTNEVGRSAALLGGFLEVARLARQPLRVLEIGASAGLNLRWDRYRYESAGGGWGDPASPVRFSHSFDIAPPLHGGVRIAERKGCDLHPIDPTSGDGALTLRSFVWADQLGRLALLDGALAVAGEVAVEVDQVDAASFLERELAAPRRDVATVVYHSVFMPYVDEADRRRIAVALETAGVHHLSLEAGESTFEVRLDGRLLGTCGPHGTRVRWLVD